MLTISHIYKVFARDDSQALHGGVCDQTSGAGAPIEHRLRMVHTLHTVIMWAAGTLAM